MSESLRAQIYAIIDGGLSCGACGTPDWYVGEIMAAIEAQQEGPISCGQRPSDATGAEQDRYAALLSEASEALQRVGKAAIVVEPFLAKPFPDAPHTSPWKQFMEQPSKRAYNLGQRIRRELKAIDDRRQNDASLGER